MPEQQQGGAIRLSTSAADGANGRPAGAFGGLSGKLLWLTVLFIMLAEVLIFFPSIASMRIRWLEDKLNTAAAAAIVIDGLQPVRGLARTLCRRKHWRRPARRRSFFARKASTSRLLAMSSMPTSVDEQYDLTTATLISSMGDALDTLLLAATASSAYTARSARRTWASKC